MEHRFFQTLHPDARAIREEVFMREQGFREEFDKADGYAECMVLYDGETPAATGRLYPLDTPGEYLLGRIAVRRAYRGRQLGAQVVAILEARAREHGARQTVISAQCRARGFYEKQGYHAEGEPYFEEFCPHIRMKKSL